MSNQDLQSLLEESILIANSSKDYSKVVIPFNIYGRFEFTFSFTQQSTDWIRIYKSKFAKDCDRTLKEKNPNCTPEQLDWFLHINYILNYHYQDFGLLSQLFIIQREKNNNSLVLELGAGIGLNVSLLKLLAAFLIMTPI